MNGSALPAARTGLPPAAGTPPTPPPMAGDKIRLRFRKTGVLRLLSHLDLVRASERMLRRAELPFRSTAGFHPTPRMVFALSLPLGADGLNEVLEVELTTPLDAENVRERLNRQAPDGLEFTSATEIPLKATAVPRSVVYTLPLPDDRVDAARRAADELMASEKAWVDRLKPRPRRLNIRPYLRAIGVATSRDREGADLEPPSSAGRVVLAPSPLTRAVPEEAALSLPRLVMSLWVTQTGTARADELLKRLGLFDLLDAGHVLARSELAVRDETPSDPTEGPPDGPPETAPLDHAPVETGDDPPALPEWGLSPNGPVVE